MKTLNKILLILFIGLIPFSSCDTEKLTDLNINPHAANELNWKFLLTNGMLLSAENRYVNWRANLIYCAHFIQQCASTGGHAGDKYYRNTSYSASYFDYVYTRALKNLSEVIRQTDPTEGANPEMTNARNIARILRVVNMHRMTDLYGDVPYSEANKGLDGIFKPKYDAQKDIYTDMLKELDEAVNGLSASADDIADADLIYKGDLDKWKKFGNSMMLRLGMRVSKIDAGMATTYVTKAINGGVMESNDDNAWIPMADGPDQWTNQNGTSRALIQGDGSDGALLSKTLVDFLKDRNDPRLMIISGGIGPWGGPYNTNYNEQDGLPNGHDYESLRILNGWPEDYQFDTHTTYSRINPLLLKTDAPYFLQSYSEVALLLAEVAASQGQDAIAEAQYNKGVAAAMQMYELYDASFVVSNGDVTSYLAANPYDPAKGEEMIGEQYWAATFLNWYEGYANWRRTGFPSLTPHNFENNVTGGRIPLRLEYPLSEYSINADNVSAANARQGKDDFMTPVWWDK